MALFMDSDFMQNIQTFKQTFQKPSQIYKYLADVWELHPLYLIRNLSYVSKHRNRPVKNRETSIDLCSTKLWMKRKARFDKRTKDYIDRKSKGFPIPQVEDEKVEQALADYMAKTKVRCYYNWICNDNKTSQKTKSYGYICAWCEHNLHHLDSLIMHLKLCHSRFNFNIVEEDSLPVIEMRLNPTFDGSYCGFKYPGHDLKRDFKFTPSSPKRKTPSTQIIFFRTKRKQLTNINNQKSGLNSYDNYDEGEIDVEVCSGRLYYHTSTCLPVKLNEVDLDSEADMDPEWLRERTQLMIDEFTDVNEGEKEILKLWNLHIMKNYKYKGDNMIRQACFDFVALEGSKILSKNLYKNFVIHLTNLFDFGLIGSRDMIECIRNINKLKRPSPIRSPGKTRPERNSNEHCQHSPAKRALLN